jgi:putative heme-binding domain-containing protein
MSSHQDDQLLARLQKKWGKLSPSTDGEKQARISYIQLILGRATTFDPNKGMPIFEQKCATCHQLFGKGQKIGPDLTSAERQALAPLVGHIVDPSANIRPEFRAFVVETKDGRVITGLVAEETAGAVTLLDAKGERIVIPRERIGEMKASSVSLMPEKILDTLSDQEIIDFFAYLRLREPPR